MQKISGISVFGEPLMDAVEQMRSCLEPAFGAALMGDHHLGYSVPVGGVIAYEGKVSPSGVGFDIACGNKAVLTDAFVDDIRGKIGTIMDDVVSAISFGVGRVNNEPVDSPVFDRPEWDIPAVRPLKGMAQAQLGTVGSGNHYVDIFGDERGQVWIGCHFGSRGLGHKIATHYIREGGGKDGIHVAPVVLDETSRLGSEYIAAMSLAGAYAYAGRDWVCNRVVKILGAHIRTEVHNHHNFAWKERHSGRDLWVVRKGATPAFPGQPGFVGGTMGEDSVILQGRPESQLSRDAFFSTVHGAGRVMSRTEAAGKSKWVGGRKVRKSEGRVSTAMMSAWVAEKGVILRGGGVDESPHCYKRLNEVLAAQGETIEVVHTLTPLGVAMAGDEFDPYKD